jgi:hypothetical protein
MKSTKKPRFNQYDGIFASKVSKSGFYCGIYLALQPIPFRVIKTNFLLAPPTGVGRRYFGARSCFFENFALQNFQKNNFSLH